MHRAIMSSMDQVLLLCPRPLISLYVSIWASPLDLWYPRPRFRAWTGGGDREAGSSQTDTGRNATGIIDTATWMRDVSGVLYATKAGRAVSGTGIDDEYDCLNIDLARVWGEHAGTEFAPTHIRIPVVFYLGRVCKPLIEAR